MDDPKQIRICLAGDGNTGKTCLMYAYVKNAFLEQYQPTTFDQNHVEVTIHDKQNQPIKYTIILTDVAGQHDYDKLREPAYKNVDVFVLTYSCVSTDSYDNIKAIWLPEIQRFNKQREEEERGKGLRASLRRLKLKNTKESSLEAPVILVGTKSDLKRENSGKSFGTDVSTVSGDRLKEQINALSFIECSALTQENVKRVFDSAILAALENKDDNLSLTSSEFDPKKSGPNKKQSNKKSKSGICNGGCNII